MGVYKREYRKGGKAAWYYQFRHHKIKYAAAGFLSEKDAKAAEQKKLNDLNSKTNQPLASDKVSFKQFLPKFLEHRTRVRSQETTVREGRRATPMVRFFGEKRITQITAGTINDYVAKRIDEDEICERSMNLELTFLRSYFKFAIQSGYSLHNPAQGVTNLKEIQHKKWTPTEEELLRFIEAAKKTASAEVFVPWVWFRAYTGTRPKESFFMEWSDIDFDRNQIWIQPKAGNPLKNRKCRVVEMHPKLKPILLEWRKQWEEVFAKRQKRHPEEKGTPHNWVFYNPHDQDARAISFFRCFYQARENAGMHQMTSHAIRHYFISQCLMSDITKDTIAEWVGHNGTRMIEQVYGHLTSKFRHGQMAKLAFDSEREQREKRELKQSAQAQQTEPIVPSIPVTITENAENEPFRGFSVASISLEYDI